MMGVDYQLLTRHEVLAFTKMSKRALHRKIDEEELPRPIRLEPQAVRWRRWEVGVWTPSRPTA